MIHRSLAFAAAALLFGAAPAFADGADVDATDPAALYGKHCGECHQPKGEGTIGMIPPLRADVLRYSTTATGRQYLIHVVARGIVGPIQVSGQMYVGVMPGVGQTVDAATEATVLNYVVGSLASDGKPPANFEPFTEAEVGRVLSDTLTPNQVYRMRQDLQRAGTARR